MALRARRPQKEEHDPKIIEINAQMQGSLIFRDAVTLKINGVFKGSLELKGTLTIGEEGDVEADIIADNVIVAGKIRGNITANKMLVLMPTSELRGDITTAKLNIVEGAIFQGSCQMMEGLLNLDEVANYLEIDLVEIEALANAGKIPGTKTGSSWKFERTQIDNWAASAKLNS
ncbi:MAG: polymer-forming cytoskeletal protein [Candidatus Omnitrophica bacterium]|nr:polymer-forming cytoskeletal protein [Candidatus Omnitrophota bacterium]